MTIATLTWNLNAEYVIPVASTEATYSEFLNTLITMIGASTYWKVTGSGFDAGNNRGYVELASKDATAGITEGRVLIAYSSIQSSAKLNASWLNAPFAAAAATNLSRAWIAFSPNANTAGPVNDPFGASDPYSGKTYSKFWPCGGTRVAPGAIMGFIESNEAFCLYWTCYSDTSSVWQQQQIIAGRIAENYDASAAEWGAIWSNGPWVSGTFPSQFMWGSTTAAYTWDDSQFNVVAGYPGPIPLALRANSTITVGTGPTSHGAFQKSDGSLYGFGRVGEGVR